MPNPSLQSVTPIASAALNNILSKRMEKQPEGDSEIMLLRKEIQDLKALITPSIILTGQRAIDEYWRLTAPSK